MAIPQICLGRSGSGAGGYSGGGGPNGQASNNAGGSGVSGTGYPSIHFVTNSRQKVDITLTDTLGGDSPVDLSTYHSLRFLAKEIMNTAEYYLNKNLTIMDSANGIVRLSLAPRDLPFAGIWYAAVQGLNSDHEVVDEYICWLDVSKSLSHDLTYNHPITIPEIRMALRDTCAGANSLLDDMEFSDTEINFAIMRPVEEWNETPPEIILYTAATFPYREAWRKATCSYLLNAAVYNYARNSLPYNAGGVTIDDKNKFKEYASLATLLRNEWKEFMIAKKVEINIDQFFGTVGMPYFRRRRPYFRV